MQEEEIKRLVERYLHDLASEEEKERLTEWYHSKNTGDIEWEIDDAGKEEVLKNRIYNQVKRKIADARGMSSRPLWHRLSIAASVLVLIATGLYLFTTKAPVEKYAVQKEKRNLNSSDIQPAGDKAILTLANGSKILLDDTKNGVLAEYGGITIRKNAQGQLIYTFSDEAGVELSEAGKAAYNTIETPAGGKYQLNLADGTKVWLNASSSLRFPTSFTKDSRVVELTGEAYFEVAKDKGRRFKVKSHKQSVEVLGTHFNINAYPEEPSVKTTLLEGSVRVTELAGNTSDLLKPGEQSKVDEKITVVKADTEAAMAWKEGYFYFKDADIKTVMRQLERWYGITTRYEGVLPEQRFAGAIANNLTLRQVLEILEKSQVHFRLVGKEVIVM